MTQSPVAGDIEFNASCMHDLAALMTVIEQAGRRAGADDDALFSIRLAVEEVFTNILDYGYRGGTGPITVHIDTQPERVRITLADVAPLFDPATVAEPAVDTAWDERAVGGWGWHFVRQVMDKVEWAPRAEGGNLFTLVKSLPGTGSRQQGVHRSEH